MQYRANAITDSRCWVSSGVKNALSRKIRISSGARITSTALTPARNTAARVMTRLV